MRHIIFFTLMGLGILLLIEACKKSSEDQPDNVSSSFDRKALLTNERDHIIIPAYTAFQENTAALNTAVSTFIVNPSAATLSDVQTKFLDTYRQWQSTSAFDFGPASQLNFRVNINTYPADVHQINANIQANTYDPNLFTNLAAKGLPALDYLLFGLGNNNDAILAQYTTANDANNRKTYLSTLAKEMGDLATSVLDAWKTSYSTTFLEADGTDIGSSLGQLVNQLVYDYEVLKNYEVGIPAGIQSMGTTFPEKVQAYYAHISLELALLHIQALENIYLGKSGQNDGLGLDDYLNQVHANYSDGNPLNTVIQNQFTTAIAKLKTLTDPLSAEIKSHPAEVSATYTELQKITVLLKTDMTSALGILITYGDNDGD